MATHKEIRERKQNAINFAYDVVRQRGTVRLNDLHQFFADVWKYQLTFIQEIKKVIPDDITLTSERKVGTIATFDPAKAIRLSVIRQLPEIVADRKKEKETGTVRGKNQKILAKRRTLAEKVKARREQEQREKEQLRKQTGRDSRGRFVKRSAAV